MKHNGTHRIETERLIIRKYKITDTEDMFINWASSTAVTRFLTWPPYTRTADVRAYIKGRIEAYQSPECYDWVIEWKENHQAIGSISVVKYDENRLSAEIGYCLGEAYWHKGIMPEALRAVIRYLFRETDFECIEACHDMRNVCSGKVMEKCGLEYDHTERREIMPGKGEQEMIYRSLLKKDYARKS